MKYLNFINQQKLNNALRGACQGLTLVILQVQPNGKQLSIISGYLENVRQTYQKSISQKLHPAFGCLYMQQVKLVPQGPMDDRFLGE